MLLNYRERVRIGLFFFVGLWTELQPAKRERDQCSPIRTEQASIIILALFESAKNSYNILSVSPTVFEKSRVTFSTHCGQKSVTFEGYSIPSGVSRAQAM